MRALLRVRDLEAEDRYVFFVTRQGTVKKTAVREFSNVMARGIIAIGVDKGDELVAAALTDGNEIVFLATHEGMAIRFDENDVRTMGRPAYGVRGMDLDEGDYIVGMAVTPKTEAGSSEEKPNGKAGKNGKSEEPVRAVANMILTVTENGYGKRTVIDEYRLQSRGGKGVINVKTTARNGKVVAVLLVSEESQGMVISQFGQIIRIPTDQVREAGRATQGVRLLSLDPGDRVAAAVVIPEEKEEEENGSLIQ
jgi:DNA gyrase subunit A